MLKGRTLNGSFFKGLLMVRQTKTKIWKLQERPEFDAFYGEVLVFRQWIVVERLASQRPSSKQVVVQPESKQAAASSDITNVF